MAGLPGGPVNVLTVYPQHSTVVAAACHSQIPSRDPFTSASLLLSLSWFVFLSSPSRSLSILTFFFWLIHPTNPSLLSLLPSSFQEETAREREREERERERELLLCCLSPSTSRPPSALFEFLKRLKYPTYVVIVYLRRLSTCVCSKITSYAIFIPRWLFNIRTKGVL